MNDIYNPKNKSNLIITQNKLFKKVDKILSFKKEKLSRLKNDCPSFKLGACNKPLKHIQDYLESLDNHFTAFGGVSFLHNTSEATWYTDICNRPEHKQTNASIKLRPMLDDLAVTALETISNMFGEECIITRESLDTIDDDSCIIPHCDFLLFHAISLRVHIPIIASERSYFVSFTPDTFIPQIWNMKTEGNMYVINDFEPHAVSKLPDNKKIRSHYLCDITFKSIIKDISLDELNEIKYILPRFCQGSNNDYVIGGITHTNSNIRIRNILNNKYSTLEYTESVKAQYSQEYVQTTKKYLQQICLDAEVAKNIIRI